MEFSLVLPCLNEEENIGPVVRETVRWMERRALDGEIIVVNDGSTDGTSEVLGDLEKTFSNVRVVTHPENRGYGSAVRSGCDSARGEWIGFMDGDRQFKAEDFDRLLPLRNQWNFIIGRRRKRADPFRRKVNAKLFGILSLFLLGIWVRDINCAMKIFRKSAWTVLRPTHATGALFNAELFLRAKCAGIRWTQVDVPHYPRLKGHQTGANLRVIARMFKELWMLVKTKSELGRKQ